MHTMNQDDFKIELIGEVTPPPLLVEILARIAAAADQKCELLLSPGETRVLTNYLSTFEE